MDVLGDLAAYDAGRVRNGQVELGPSNVGTCIRRSGFKHHGVTPTNPSDNGKARLGTLLHLGWAVIARAAGKDPEVEVTVPGLRAPGHADVIDWPTRTVTDLKTTGDLTWQRWVTFGLPDSTWDQVELYAYGLNQAPPHEVGAGDRWTLEIIALNRETGQEAPFVRPADPVRGAMLAERMVDRQDMLDASTSPYDLPREGAGPDRGFPCDYCQFLDACWGPPRTDDLSRQAATVVDDPEVVASIAEQYLEATEALGVLEQRKKDARAYLQGIPAGEYGGARLRWQGGRRLASEPDPTAMALALEAAGLPVPTRTKTSARSLRVTRVPPSV